MTFQRILKRWSAKRRQRSGQSWFVETEEEIVLFAIINFGKQSRAVANRSLHTSVVKRRRFGFQPRIAKQTKHQIEIRKLIVTARAGAHFPFLIRRPGDRRSRREFRLVCDAAMFDANSTSEAHAALLVVPGVLKIIALLA